MVPRHILEAEQYETLRLPSQDVHEQRLCRHEGQRDKYDGVSEIGGRYLQDSGTGRAGTT